MSESGLTEPGRRLVRLVGRFEEYPRGPWWNEVRIPSTHLVVANAFIQQARPIGLYVTVTALPELPRWKP